MADVTNTFQKEPPPINKRPLYILWLALVAVYFAISYTAHERIHATIIENKLEDLNQQLIYQKSLRSYVQNELKPLFYELQLDEVIPYSYFDSRALSSTYISRRVFQIYDQKAEKLGLPKLGYGIVSDNPRNPVNQANEQELALLEQFNADHSLTKVERIEEVDGKQTLYVAVPLDPNNASCLRCHGHPSTAPQDLIEKYGDKKGFNEKIGRIRAFISYRFDLEDAIGSAQNSFILVALLILIAMFLFGLLISWLYISEQKRRHLILEKQRETDYIAHHDFLTKLHNRYWLNKALPKQLQQANAVDVDVAGLWVIMLDIDLFKTINDDFGHNIGDKAIIAMADILNKASSAVADSDVFRLGGEEFLIILPLAEREDVEKVYSSIQQGLLNMKIVDLPRQFTISAGATKFSGNETQYDLLKRADNALYKAKDLGRDQIVIDDIPNHNQGNWPLFRHHLG